MKRLTASQKSSRTMTRHWTRTPVALPQGPDQFRVLLAAVRMQPLLELVDDQQHLFARREALPAAEGRQDLHQAELFVQSGQLPAKISQQALLRFAARCFHVDFDDRRVQPRQQTGLHQRRLAAARGPVDQSHGKRFVDGSVAASILDFQKRMLSGIPSRSRGPASSSRKKSASLASNERSPLGTTFRTCRSDEGDDG